jgi:hypothetical protein
VGVERFSSTGETPVLLDFTSLDARQDGRVRNNAINHLGATTSLGLKPSGRWFLTGTYAKK